MPRTFAELEQDETVTAQELREVLDEYVETGAAIHAATVIALINRTNLTAVDRKHMQATAERGRTDQHNRRFSRDAAAYQQVADHLRT